MRAASTSPLLSTLVRLKVDPGEEAAILARLPREAAISRLAMLIAALPDGSPTHLNPAMTAAQLIALLPYQSGAIGQPPRTLTHSTANSRAAFYATLMIFMLSALCLATCGQPLE